MRTGLLSEMHPFTKFIFAILLAFLSFFVISFIGALVAIIIFHVGINELSSLLQSTPSEENIPLLKYFQLLQSIGLFLIPAIVLARLIFKNGLNSVGLRIHVEPAIVGWVLLLMVFGFPLVNLLSEWNLNMRLPGFLSSLEETFRKLEESAVQMTEAFLQSKSFAGLFYNLILIAILPALGEELFFRGIVQRIFIDWTKSPWLGIFIAAFLFSFMHLQFYGFFPRFYLGFIFGVIYYWSGSIWLPILAHFINNAAAVILLFIYGQETVGKNIDAIGTKEGNWYYIVISILFVGVSLWQIYSGKSVGVIRSKN